MKELSLENYTQSQIEAITSVDGNTLVTASAGSGKTSVLVSRISYILKEKLANLDEILVVTFTNLASLEMKQRVKKDLEEMAKFDDSFITQLELLNTADISTLHKFCQKIIKEYFYETQTDPNFRILEENESFYLMNQALNETMEAEFEKNDANFVKLVKLFNEKRNDENFKNTMVNVYQFLKSKNNNDNFLEDMIENSYCDDFSKNKVIKYFNSYIEEFLQYFLEKFEHLLLEANQINSKQLCSIINEYVNYAKCLCNKSFEEKFNFLMSDISFSQIRLTKPIAEETELKEKFKLVVSLFKKELDNIKNIIQDRNINEVKEKMFNCKPYFYAIGKFLQEFDKNYTNKKIKTNGLDFNDLEQRCLLTLQNDKICSAIKNKYKFIFVDEYQDTNEIQEAILNKVSNEENMFMVGDVKQSIYLFRECSPQIFINKFNKYTYDINLGKVVALNKNFRSDKTILDFANFVFNNIMKVETSSVNYKKDAQFSFGEKFISNKNSQYPVVSLKLINQLKMEDEQEFNKQYDLFNAPVVKEINEKLNNEIKVIIKEIKNLVNNKIYDNDLKDYRNIKYGDIAILSRKKNSVVKYIVQEFKKNNIPVSTEYGVNIFDSYENKLLINFLSLINNFNNDIALVSVLTSFMYALTYNDLIIIKSTSNNATLYESIKDYIDNRQDELSTKLIKLINDIQYFKKQLLIKSKHEVFDLILNKYYVIEYFSTKENSEDIIQNIEMLKQNLQAFNDISLNEYLSYVEEFAKNKTSQIQFSSQDDSVKVMSIHASKGLEFPVVFLINSNAEFSKKGLNDKLITNQKNGIGIKTFNADKKIEENNIIRNVLKLINNEEEKQEEMRLLYVAITRAKNHLIIVGTLEIDKLTKITSSYEIKKSNSYLKWIMGCMPENVLNQLKSGEKEIKLKLEENNAIISIIDNGYQEENNIENKVSFYPKLLDNEFERKYLNSIFRPSNINLKNSVTAIMNLEDDFNLEDFKQTKKQNSDQDYLLIGNMYHLVMEKIDYKNILNIEQVKHFLNELVYNNIITLDESNLIDCSLVRNACMFLRSIINDGDVVLKEKTFMCYAPANNLMNTENTSKILIQGIADLIVIKNDEVVLVDYKTTKFKEESLFAKKYSTQLNLYAKAIENFYGKKVTKKYIYSFYFDKALII